METAYESIPFSSTEMPHGYGKNVHLLADPFALTQLSRLCRPGVVVPEVSGLVRSLYTQLLRAVVNQEFPRKNVSIPSRMESLIEGASYRGEIVDPETRVTTVDIARAGILPSQVCFDELCGLMRPEAIRQDHLMMSRLTAEDQRVTGAGIGGMKLAGPVDGRVLLFPDPMGATGSSLATAIQFYKDKAKEHPPAKIITLNLIVTPQFIQRLTSEHPEVAIYAFRLDRGMSPETILQSGLGEYAAEESGLTETQYIVPGGGGFGELLNNALE